MRGRVWKIGSCAVTSSLVGRRELFRVEVARESRALTRWLIEGLQKVAVSMAPELSSSASASSEPHQDADCSGLHCWILPVPLRS